MSINAVLFTAFTCSLLSFLLGFVTVSSPKDKAAPFTLGSSLDDCSLSTESKSVTAGDSDLELSFKVTTRLPLSEIVSFSSGIINSSSSS